MLKIECLITVLYFTLIISYYNRDDIHYTKGCNFTHQIVNARLQVVFDTCLRYFTQQVNKTIFCFVFSVKILESKLVIDVKKEKITD